MGLHPKIASHFYNFLEKNTTSYDQNTIESLGKRGNITILSCSNGQSSKTRGGASIRLKVYYKTGRLILKIFTRTLLKLVVCFMLDRIFHIDFLCPVSFLLPLEIYLVALTFFLSYIHWQKQVLIVFCNLAYIQDAQ